MLFRSRSFLINDDAEQVSKLDFPNFWHQGNLKLKLTYQFEPGKMCIRDRNNSSLPRTATGDDPQKFGAKYSGRTYQQAILSLSLIHI